LHCHARVSSGCSLPRSWIPPGIRLPTHGLPSGR
jgi:hypothetical protein